ncbi:MAG: hypothetical protein ACM3W4_09605 [Ignavibacteriales bacterium]
MVASLQRIGFRKQLVGSVLIAAVLVAIPGFFRPSTPTLLIMGLLFAAGPVYLRLHPEAGAVIAGHKRRR